MRKIVAYKIVYSHSIEMLSQKVADAIAEGWQPYGEFGRPDARAPLDHGVLDYYREMVKYELQAVQYGPDGLMYELPLSSPLKTAAPVNPPTFTPAFSKTQAELH